MDALRQLRPHFNVSPEVRRDIIEEADTWADSILTTLHLSLENTVNDPKLSRLIAQELHNLSIHIGQDRMDSLSHFFPTTAALGNSLRNSFARKQKSLKKA